MQVPASKATRGFTLIELLIVVAIIAILAAIAVPNFLEAQTRAKVSRAYNDMRCTATGLESYFVDNNRYPPNQQTGPFYWLYVPWNITSPISYVTPGCFMDVFRKNEGDIDESQTGSDNPQFADRLIYFNTLQFTDLVFAQNVRLFTSDGSLYTPRPPEKQGAWQLSSFGPDLQWGPETPQRSNPQVVILYDPTNGTVSFGDLVRTQRDPLGRGVGE